MVELQIDGRPVRAEPGSLVIDAAASAGIAIPSLCHHRELAPSGNCRLCLVEIEGWRTESPRIAQARRAALELVLARYHDPQWGRHARPESEFEYWCRHYGASSRAAKAPSTPSSISSRPRCPMRPIPCSSPPDACSRTGTAAR